MHVSYTILIPVIAIVLAWIVLAALALRHKDKGKPKRRNGKKR